MHGGGAVGEAVFGLCVVGDLNEALGDSHGPGLLQDLGSGLGNGVINEGRWVGAVGRSNCG